MSGGGWFRAVAAGWPEMMETASRPLSRANAVTDLRWHLDQTGDVPGRPALRARWGWTDYAVRTLLQDEAAWYIEVRQRSDSRATADRQPSDSRRLFKRRESSRNRQPSDSEPTADRQPNSTRALIQTSDSDDRLQTTVALVTTPSEVAVVALAEPVAAPAALGPADPASDEPDWDALPTAVPLTYDEEADDDRGAVDPEADSAPVVALAQDRRDAPSEVASAMAGDNDSAVPPRGLRAAALGSDAPADAVLTLPLEGVTRPPPATRATDVDALWEAWRGYGTVRGRPNPKRRKLMESALKKHGLSTMLNLLAAAHTGAGDYWRHLQGATPRNDTPYLSPETLLNSRRDERVERAAAWVAAGRPTHDVAETRVEARAQAVARPAKERALAAWDRVPEFAGLSLDQAKEAMARWPQENQRAMLAGLEAVGGLSTLGRLDSFARQRKRGDFVRGVVEALGGKLTEAELREVG